VCDKTAVSTHELVLAGTSQQVGSSQ